MLLIFVVCGFRSLRNTSELALHGGTGVHWECRNGRPSCCLRDLQRDYSTGSSEVSIVERVNGCERPNGAVSSSELSCWRRSESVLCVLVFTMPRERSNGFKTEGTLRAV